MTNGQDGRGALQNLAAFTGKSVSHYEELLEIMREEDRVEFFPRAIARETGLPLSAVWALLTSRDSPIQ
jgi:hypothetical protein